MSLRFLILGLLPLTAWAGFPLPDHVLYGTIALENQAVTRRHTDVVIEARRTVNGPVLASYRMGSQPRLGDYFYELRLELEEQPRESVRSAEPGETLFITVRDDSGQRFQTTHRLTEPGVALRLDFGLSLDADGDGVPEGWEVAHLGSSTPNLGGDSDGDGMVDRDEYAAGTHPLDATDVFRLAVHSAVGKAVQVSFRALSATGIGFDGRRRFYALEFSTNLVSGTWGTVENHSRISGADQLVTFQQAADGTNAPPFFRARVWLEGP